MARRATLVIGSLLLAPVLHAQPPASGRVVAPEEFSDALPTSFYADMQAQADANIAQLARSGALPAAKAKSDAADLAWPLHARFPFDQFDYHGISNFVDHDARTPGFVQDYTCGTRSYDLASGYNHAGTDYYLWPFPWLMMDQAQVEIVAAAAGVLIAKADGNFDRQCFFDNTSQPNFVRILQDDGLSAIYLHMRSGSVTTVPIGTRVAARDYLGLVGSSGQSTGPHLHFELRDANGTVVDPRHGECNAGPDRWTVFQGYEEPHIDSLSTHSTEPNQIACGFVNDTLFDDEPAYKTVFAPGDDLWVFASYRDQRAGEGSAFSILQPDGTAFAQWQFDLADSGLPRPFYSGTAWDWKYTLPQNAQSGVWQVRAVFQGFTYARNFVVQDPLVVGAARARRAQAGAAATRCRPQAGDTQPVACAP